MIYLHPGRKTHSRWLTLEDLHARQEMYSEYAEF
jgi:hypothetical protein